VRPVSFGHGISYEDAFRRQGQPAINDRTRQPRINHGFRERFEKGIRYEKNMANPFRFAALGCTGGSASTIGFHDKCGAILFIPPSAVFAMRNTP
jgi:hypothetical protein